MSNYTPKDNSGVLFKNDKREKETHPNAKGSALIDGVEYWVSAWTKEGKAGKFQSLSFEKKEAAPAKAAPRRPSRDTADDDVPF
jgi:hypothetical protein